MLGLSDEEREATKDLVRVVIDTPGQSAIEVVLTGEDELMELGGRIGVVIQDCSSHTVSSEYEMAQFSSVEEDLQ